MAIQIVDVADEAAALTAINSQGVNSQVMYVYLPPVHGFTVCTKDFGGTATIAHSSDVLDTKVDDVQYVSGNLELLSNSVVIASLVNFKTILGLALVDNTTDLSKPINTATQTALDTKVDTIGLNKASVGLSNVDNTADLSKPISTATQTALDTKVDTLGLNKASVGLANVDNTSDLSKPVSTATQTVLDTKTSTVDVVDNTVTADATKMLSANQGVVLQGLINNINVLLTSNDTTLDDLQEIVNFIKLNKTTLDALGIASIAGLQIALDGKVNIDGAKVLTDENYGTAAKALVDKLLITGRDVLLLNSGGLINQEGFAFSSTSIDTLRSNLRLFHDTIGFDGASLYLGGNIALADVQKTAIKNALNIVAGVKADWNAAVGTTAEILNKPDLTVLDYAPSKTAAENTANGYAVVGADGLLPSVVVPVTGGGVTTAQVNTLIDDHLVSESLAVVTKALQFNKGSWQVVDDNLSVRISPNSEQLQFKYTNANGYPTTIWGISNYKVKHKGKNYFVSDNSQMDSGHGRGWSFGRHKDLGLFNNNYEFDGNDKIEGTFTLTKANWFAQRDSDFEKVYSFKGRRFNSSSEKDKQNNGKRFNLEFVVNGKSLSNTGINK